MEMTGGAGRKADIGIGVMQSKRNKGEEYRSKQYVQKTEETEAGK